MDTTQKTLSIRLQPDGFLFSTLNTTEDGSFRMREVTVTPGQDFPARLKNQILETGDLLGNYRAVHITVATPRVTLYPALTIDETTAERLFRLACGETDDAETMMHEVHASSGIGFIFGIDEELAHFLGRTFPEAIYHHPLSILHAYFVEKSKMGNNAKMIAQVSRHGIDLLAYRNGQLLLAHSHADEAPDDMAYHILNTWDKCGLEAHRDLLQLAGDKLIQAQLTERLAPVVEHIVPAVFPAQLFDLGPDTLHAPWDTILLTFYPHP